MLVSTSVSSIGAFILPFCLSLIMFGNSSQSDSSSWPRHFTFFGISTVFLYQFAFLFSTVIHSSSGYSALVVNTHVKPSHNLFRCDYLESITHSLAGP